MRKEFYRRPYLPCSVKMKLFPPVFVFVFVLTLWRFLLKILMILLTFLSVLPPHESADSRGVTILFCVPKAICGPQTIFNTYLESAPVWCIFVLRRHKQGHQTLNGRRTYDKNVQYEVSIYKIKNAIFTVPSRITGQASNQRTWTPRRSE